MSDGVSIMIPFKSENFSTSFPHCSLSEALTTTIPGPVMMPLLRASTYVPIRIGVFDSNYPTTFYS